MGHALKENLTDQQAIFVAHYLTNGFNATRAAIDAGYSVETARFQASDLLTRPNITAAVAKRLHDVINPTRIEAEIASIAEVDMLDFEGLGEGKTLKELHANGVDTRQVKKLITRTLKDGTVKREIELHDRHAALDKLARIHAMFVERSENRSEVEVKLHDLTGLSDATKAKVLDELGGPEE